MCIAIVKPAHLEIDKATLKACHENNGDGCGFAYINTDKKGVKRIKVKKSLDFEEFYTKYTKALTLAPDSPFLIHFRIKTHGKINLSNCHPFKIDKSHAFIHNGTISGVSTSAEKSDTMMFNEEVLRELPKGWMNNKAIVKLVEGFIGSSKIAVLDLDGGYKIFNESKGVWADNIWYSNSTYKPRSSYSASTQSPFDRGVYSGGATTGTTRDSSSYNCVYSHSLNTLRYNKSNKKYRPFEENSYVPCDHCGIFRPVKDLYAYFKHNNVLCFCQSCEKKDTTWLGIDSVILLSIDAHLDWLNESQLDFDIFPYYMEGEWVNPWIAEDYDPMVREIEETEEAQEVVFESLTQAYGV